MLEEISKLNDVLYPIFLGKYFVRYLLDVPEPRWIVSNSREFDAIYRAQKMKLNEVDNAGKKRSTSATCAPQKKFYY